MRKNAKPSPYLQMPILEAFKHIARDTFQHLENPAPSLMWTVIKTIPLALARMPQAQTHEMQRKALRGDGKLLGTKVAWKFDTEYEFPGSTAWAIHHQLSLSNYFKALDFSKEKTLDDSWQLVSKFSTRPAWSISQETRDLLTAMPFCASSGLIENLLKLPAGATLAPMKIDDSIAASMASLMIGY